MIISRRLAILFLVALLVLIEAIGFLGYSYLSTIGSLANQTPEHINAAGYPLAESKPAPFDNAAIYPGASIQQTEEYSGAAEDNAPATDVAPADLAPAYIVAASDAPASRKAQADVVCDGIADEVEINAALADGYLDVKLTEGTFYTAATISCPQYSHLSGIAPKVTTIRGNVKGPVVSIISSQTTVNDLTIWGLNEATTACISGCNFSFIHDVYCRSAAQGAGILVTSSSQTPMINRVSIYSCQYGIRFETGAYDGIFSDIIIGTYGGSKGNIAGICYDQLSGTHQWNNLKIWGYDNAVYCNKAGELYFTNFNFLGANKEVIKLICDTSSPTYNIFFNTGEIGHGSQDYPGIYPEVLLEVTKTGNTIEGVHFDNINFQNGATGPIPGVAANAITLINNSSNTAGDVFITDSQFSPEYPSVIRQSGQWELKSANNSQVLAPVEIRTY